MASWTGSFGASWGSLVIAPRQERAAVELARREALLAELNAIDGLRWGASASHPTVIRAREAIEEARERPLDQ